MLGQESFKARVEDSANIELECPKFISDNSLPTASASRKIGLVAPIVGRETTALSIDLPGHVLRESCSVG
jgi:hypothetical protein